MAKPLPKGIDRLPSGLYRIRFYKDGVQYSAPATRTLTEAKEALAALRTDVTRGEWVASRGGITLNEWFQQWNPTRAVRDTTRQEDARRYELHVKAKLGHRPLRSITPDMIAHFMGGLELSGSTKRLVFALLSACLGRKGALRAGLVRANPCASVEAPRVQRKTFLALSREQVAQLAESMREEHRIALLTAVFTGLRWSEMVGLAVEDWHRDQGLLHVHQAVRERGGKFIVGDTKGSKARTVPVHPELAVALKEHVGERTEGPLIVTSTGQPLRHSNFRRDAWLPALAATGIQARWHDLRHTAATWFLEGGASVQTVRDLLGHASIQTTEIYLHTNPERLRAAVEALQGFSLPAQEGSDD